MRYQIASIQLSICSFRPCWHLRTLPAVVWPLLKRPIISQYLGNSYRRWRGGEIQPPKPAKQKRPRNKRSRRSLPCVSFWFHTNDHHTSTESSRISYPCHPIPSSMPACDGSFYVRDIFLIARFNRLASGQEAS